MMMINCKFMINLLINSSLSVNHNLDLLKTKKVAINNNTVHMGI